MTKFKSSKSGLVDWMIAGVLGSIAAVLYFSTMSGYAFPGESARLMVHWRGLDLAVVNEYPLMAVFAGIFGFGNAIAPVCGAVAVACIYRLTSFFVRERIGGEMVSMWADSAGRIAGIVAASVFMFTPAVHEAATHLEPRLFDFAWVLLTASLFIPFLRAPRAVAWMFPILIGMFCGFGLADTPLFFALLPLFLLGVVVTELKRGKKAYLSSFLFLSVFALSFAIFAGRTVGDFSIFSRLSVIRFKEYYSVEKWLLVCAFSTIPFVVSLFSSYKAYNEESGWTQWIFHSVMTFIIILAVATPLSPSSLMEPYGLLPVATSGFAAVVAGYLAAYWWLLVKAPVRKNESRDSLPIAHLGRPIALVSGSVLALTLVIAGIWNLFTFERDRGEFADRVAGMILDDLGDRTWMVTDGSIDDHILLVAADRGKEINLINLHREDDSNLSSLRREDNSAYLVRTLAGKYLEQLQRLVEKKKLGGNNNKELVSRLNLGIVPFLRQWVEVDDGAAGKLVMTSPLLWGARVKPVPERFFFGADPSRKADITAWNELDSVLHAPAGWGSYRMRKIDNPIDRLRLHIRRHLGFVANNRGIYLQNMKNDDAAYNTYDFVLSKIDPDNFSALCNIIEMARGGYRKAVDRKKELDRALNDIVADTNRRYDARVLSRYYGDIRSPAFFIKLNLVLARSGYTEEALATLSRASDFISTDRDSTLMNMMAALYANEPSQRKSREIYSSILARDNRNHAALIGMMRLELMDGNNAKALEYLEKAAKVTTDAYRANIELAMIAMMKRDLDGAKKLLLKAVDTAPEKERMHALSLLAAVEMQRCDEAKESKDKDVIIEEIENEILSKMEKIAKGEPDYHLQTTRAFILMRKGADKRREARDAFVDAAKTRPDIETTHDLILGLDISLNDVAAAKDHAIEVLRRNRNAPLANYVMGSLELQGGDKNQMAEIYLRKAADARKPVVLALNDLAEALRRNKKYDEAEIYARKAVKAAPKLYIAWETLGSILLNANRNIDEAEKCILKACELSRDDKGREEDVRMLISLARVQLAKGDNSKARTTLRKVNKRVSELSEYEKQEFEELRKRAR